MIDVDAFLIKKFWFFTIEAIEVSLGKNNPTNQKYHVC